MGLNDSSAFVSLGNALDSLKRYEEALAAYEQAIGLDPTYTDAYTGKEELLRMLRHEGEV